MLLQLCQRRFAYQFLKSAASIIFHYPKILEELQMTPCHLLCH